MSDNLAIEIARHRRTQEKVAELQAQVDAVRGEYLNHVKATKTPVMVLDAIGWILQEQKP